MPPKTTAKKRQPLAVADSNAAFCSPVELNEMKNARDLEKQATEPFTLPNAFYSATELVAMKARDLKQQATGSPTKPTKRKASEIEDPQPLRDIDSDDDRLNYVTDNCDQVRRKIRALLNSGEMRVGQFQSAIGVSANAYGRFMGQSGRFKGDGCDAYVNAFRFFKKRELLGMKPPKKRKVSKAEEDKKNDVSNIHLDGEEHADVPVYDTCDEVRKKINAYLREQGVTKAGFLGEIAKTFGDGRKIQGKLLNDFLGKKGANAGNTSSVFYASYVFFEKMRIRDGRAKSKFREEMEKVWNGATNWEDGHKPGFDRKTRPNQWYFCSADSRPFTDKYGRVVIQRV